MMKGGRCSGPAGLSRSQERREGARSAAQARLSSPPPPPGGKRPGRYRCHRGEEHAAIYGAGKEEGTSRCKRKQGWRKRPDEGVLAGPGPSLVSDGETRGGLSARAHQRALAPSLINNIPLIWRFHQHLRIVSPRHTRARL